MYSSDLVYRKVCGGMGLMGTGAGDKVGGPVQEARGNSLRIEH